MMVGRGDLSADDLCPLIVYLLNIHKHLCLIKRIKLLPRWLSGKESAQQCRRCERLRFDPCIGQIPWRRKWRPTSVSCLENPRDREVWWAMVHGCPKSPTQLKNSTHKRKRMK